MSLLSETRGFWLMAHYQIPAIAKSIIFQCYFSAIILPKPLLW